MVISVLTDNNNRATADVKSAVGKRNGKMAESGSVYVLCELFLSVCSRAMHTQFFLVREVVFFTYA